MAETPGGDGDPEDHVNSLEMIFHPLPDSPVLMSLWETRVSDWQSYIKATGKAWEHEPAYPQTSEHPAVNVTLPEAAAFCEWLTAKEREAGLLKPAQIYRLPTHREWDAALDASNASTTTNVAVDTSAGSSQRFPWGQEWPPLRHAGNYNSRRIGPDRDDGFEFTAPVGQFAPSSEGFYDLGGNVWEWVVEDPQSGVDMGALRGGAWLYWLPECLESSYRQVTAGSTRAPTIGFRCVLDDLDKSAAYKKQRALNINQQRVEMRDQPKPTEAEINRIKNEIKPGEPSDEAARERLLNRPKVSQEEIDRVRQQLEKARSPSSQPPATPQPR